MNNAVSDNFCLRRLSPSLAPLSAAFMVSTLLLPSFANAAASTPEANNATTDGDGVLEEIVVTGFRASLASALAVKKESNEIVDVIKADDIASFPDANLAESIQRIPGVSIQRDAGEGRNVTVRGLGGDFVRTTLNGIEAFSTTTGSTLGVVAGINRSRSFDFSTFASELFNQVSVRKSQSAEMDEGSLAASIDLRTAKPFDKEGLRSAVAVSGAYYDNNKTYAPRLSGLISNTWGDYGALLSVAYSKRKAQEDGYSDTSQSDYSDALNGFCGVAVDIASQAGSQVINTAIPYVNALSGTGNRPANQCFSNKPSDPVAYAAINQPNVFLPRNPGLGRFQLNQKRLGTTLTLEWKPSDDTHVTIDGVYSDFSQNRLDWALSNASNNRNVNGASATYPLFAGRVDSQIMDVHVQDTGQVDYMKINNVDIKHIQQKSETSTKTYQFGPSWQQKFGDRFTLDVRAGVAGSKFEQPHDVFISYDAFNKDGYIWDSRNDVRRPYINYGYQVADVANVTFTNAGTGLTPDIRITNQTVNNTLKTVAGSLQFKFNDELTFKGGAMYKDFKFETTALQRLFANNGATCTASSESTTQVSGKTYSTCTTYTPFNFNQFAADFPNIGALSSTLNNWGGSLGLPTGSVTGWVVPDVAAYTNKLDLLCNCANKYGDFRLAINSALGNNRDIGERDAAFFGQTDFRYNIDGHLLRGNVGVRYVRTNVAATGYTSLTSQITVPNHYNDFLPSFNVSYAITPDLLARAAVAKVMARPGLAALSPGGTVTTSSRTASIGNPLLKPYRAVNSDLSIEWYPEKGAFYAATLFYKDIQSSIQNLAAQEAYSETGLPVSLVESAGHDGSTIYTVTRFRNTTGGYIRGLEINAQQPFSFLPGIFKNFGVSTNYTRVESQVLYWLSTGLTATSTYDQFVNVSPNSLNGTLYYDDGRFSTRVSVAYRDAYLTALPFKSELPDGNYSYGTTNVDAQVSFRPNKQLKLTLDLLNLTDQASDQYSGKVRKSQRVFSKSGRQFFAGVSYTF